MDWSYRLCDEPEQATWARPSAFSGGFDLAAAIAVCRDDDLTSEQVTEAVAELVRQVDGGSRDADRPDPVPDTGDHPAVRPRRPHRGWR